MISAENWNQSAGFIESGKLPVGREQTMGGGGNLPWGRLANRAPQTRFKHPYLIEPFWAPAIELDGLEVSRTGRKQGAWCVYIEPGFVNGFPPAIKVAGKFLPKGSQVYGNQYGKTAVGADQLVQVLLIEEPRPFLKVTGFADSRAKVLGASGEVSVGEVPLFFLMQGAKKPEPLDGLDVLNNITASSGDDFLIRLASGDAPTPRAPQQPFEPAQLPENRLLFQADIVLQVDRPSVKQQFFTDDFGIERMAGLVIELPERTQYGARIYTISVYIPPRPPTWLDIFFGTYVEPKLEEIVLGQLYLLSPTDDFRDNDIPDGSWTPFVRNKVFWNLNYASINNVDPFTTDNSLLFFKEISTVLAGGVAFLIIGSMADQIEANFDTIDTVFNQTTVKGQYWTG